MSNRTKMWLVIAACLIVVGCIIFGGVMTMLKWDFTKLSTFKYETNTYTVTESFRDISLTTDTARITFIPSENGECTIVCNEKENAKHFVGVENNTLVIKLVDNRKWYEHIGIDFTSPKITVTLPQGAYGALFLKSSTGKITIPKDFQFGSMDVSVSTGDITNYASVLEDVKIRTSTGDLTLENISARDVTLSVTTGKVNISNVKCRNLTSKGSTGKLIMQNVIAAENFSLKRTTGDIRLEGCDAAEIFAKASTGDIRGTLLSPKTFIASASTGDITVPESMTGGKCELHTTTGNIHITVG